MLSSLIAEKMHQHNGPPVGISVSLAYRIDRKYDTGMPWFGNIIASATNPRSCLEGYIPPLGTDLRNKELVHTRYKISGRTGNCLLGFVPARALSAHFTHIWTDPSYG